MAEASGDGTGIYEPLRPPFAAITPTNTGPIAMVTATPLIIITTMTVLVKTWTVWNTARKLGWKDFAMVAATALGIAYTVCVCRAVESGLGTVADELDESMMENLSKNYFASNILLVLAIACAKAAVTLLVIAIKPDPTVLCASYAVLGISICWGIASVVATALQCAPNRWALGPSDSDTCVDQYTMQIAIRTVDAITDIAIVLLPFFMMQKVQTTAEKRQIVILLFGLRIATPIFTVISIVALSDYYDASLEDRPAKAVTPSVWTTIALNLSIVTACIPSIKRFLADWAAGLSRALITDAFEIEHSAGKTNPGDNTYAAGSGLRSQLATRLGLSSTSRTGASSTSYSRGERDTTHTSRVHVRKGQPDPSRDASDSVKGLTDGVIMHTIDYQVEFEDSEPGTGGRDRSPSRSDRDHIGYGR